MTLEHKPEENKPFEGLNYGLNRRASVTQESKPFELQGPIYHDLFSQSRLLLNGVPLMLKFWPSTEKFRLMAGDPKSEYKIDILDARLNMCTVKVSPSLMLAHAEVLKSTPAIYPYQKSDIRTYTMSKGSFNFAIDDLYQGEVPNRVLVGIVSSQGYNGSFQKSPFNFEHVNLNYISFQVNGQSRPRVALTPNFKENHYVESYLTLLNGQNSKKGLGISFERYKDSGYTLFLFNLKDTPHNDHNSVQERGHTRLELKFSEALKESYTLIIYSQASKEMKIDQYRNVYLE